MNTMVPAANRKPRKRNRIFIVYVLQVYIQQVYIQQVYIQQVYIQQVNIQQVNIQQVNVPPRLGERTCRANSVSAGRRPSLAVLP
jgi:hypothetical protein